MRISDYSLYHDMLRDITGAELTPEKTFLVDSRLLPVARKWGYANLQSLAVALRALPDPALIDDIAEAMLDTETCFFRDDAPFDDLVKIAIPALIKARGRKKHLRIWSAGCSSGQEAWSIAMALNKMGAALQGWKIEILATDLSVSVLEYAAQATYATFEVQRGIAPPDLLTYFTAVDKRWRVRDDLRKLVTFKQFNLVRDTMPAGTGFDVVFCRHVMDDFADETRGKVLQALADTVVDDGFFFAGPAENRPDLCADFLPHPECAGLFTINMQSEGEARG